MSSHGERRRVPAHAPAVRFHRFQVDDLPEGRWVGPWVDPELPLAELVASWNVTLPAGAVLEVEAQIRRGRAPSAWFSLGRWAEGDALAGRTSVAGQADADAEVAVDRLVVRGAPATGYRLRLTADGHGERVEAPRLVGAVASAARSTDRVSASAPLGRAVELDVPSLSQQVHRNRHPDLGGGGASWCSPTSTAMVLSYWGTGPEAAELADIAPRGPDPFVVHAARGVFDPAYGGAGNWSFNVAYAGRFGLEAFVTRLRSLREAELLLSAGIPLVLSVAAGPGELEGFPLAGGTEGHLLVLAGVTESGDALVNDPAAASSEEVRRVYRRDQVERAWLEGSGGIVYVIHPGSVALPASGGSW